MKLSDIETGALNAQEWADKGYELPKFDLKAVRAKTHDQPTWIHFGAGNIFRAFPAALLQRVLDAGEYDRGVIVAEGFDYEIIDKAYRPYDNLSLSVLLKSDGSIEKRVVASVTESLKADPQFSEDWARLVEIFTAPSLQMVSFTITEKGYGFSPADLERGMNAQFAMGKVTALLYERFKAGALPVTLQSMDNCSHNGDKVKAGVFAYAEKWAEMGLVPAEFVAYVKDETKVTYPWSMIDKITPRPDAKVQKMLEEDGFEDNYTIITERHTFTAPFVNAEETEYLVIEDKYTNGRPPLELGGVMYADRETVDKVEKMKVCTCLNPLHTAMSIYGCMLDYTLISAEMKDEDICGLITKMGVLALIRVAYYLFGWSFLDGSWAQTAVLVLSLITVFMGSSLALREDTLKKRLAYSTVSQVSYVIFGLMLFHPLALEGAIYQAVFHAIAKNALFMATGAIIYQTHLTQVSQLRGIGGPYSITMWCFTLASLSLVGIPPTGGFVSKWFLAEGALAAETGPMAFWGIGVLMVSALLTAGYLLPVVTNGFFPGRDFITERREVGPQMTWPMIAFAAAVVLLGLLPGGLLHWLGLLAARLFP